MTEQHPDATTNLSPGLVEELRREIVALEDAASDEDVNALPDGILTLVRNAPVPLEVAGAVDEIVANVEPVDDAFAEQLRTDLRTAMSERGSGIRFLEQAASHQRSLRSLSIESVAEAIACTADAMASVEAGQSAINDELNEQQVADWIKFLALDFDEAVVALSYSLTSPASSYGGDARDRKQDAVAFVEKVRTLLKSGG